MKRHQTSTIFSPVDASDTPSSSSTLPSHINDDFEEEEEEGEDAKMAKKRKIKDIEVADPELETLQVQISLARPS